MYRIFSSLTHSELFAWDLSSRNLNSPNPVTSIQLPNHMALAIAPNGRMLYFLQRSHGDGVVVSLHSYTIDDVERIQPDFDCALPNGCCRIALCGQHVMAMVCDDQFHSCGLHVFRRQDLVRVKRQCRQAF